MKKLLKTTYYNFSISQVCPKKGFTLIEVLIALTIAAITLITAIGSVTILTQTSKDLENRLLAQWSADNRLSMIRITKEWPTVGTRNYECPQKGIRLLCQEEVFLTPNTQFRRIELNVFIQSDNRRKHKIFHVTGFVNLK